jgi:hypothetical protein
LKEFTSTGMWSLDIDAPIPERMAAGLGFGLKSSILIYARKKNLMDISLVQFPLYFS